ncbi:MAG: lysophospholipid acyltransferase family protein [Gemmataceae bacterium]
MPVSTLTPPPTASTANFVMPSSNGNLSKRFAPAAAANLSPSPVSQALGYAWYEMAYWIAMTVLTLGFSLRYTGKRNLPKSGPVLLIANHQSFLDPLAVGLASPRHLSFLARKTLFNNRLFGGLLRSLNTVPVDQQGIAKEGMKAILEKLKEGRPVLVFPEGERTWRGNIQPLKPGIQLLIKRTHCPIVPVGIAGAFDALPRTRPWPLFSPLFMPATRGAIGVAVGKPLDSERYAAMPREQMLLELEKELEKVHAEAERIRRK